MPVSQKKPASKSKWPPAGMRDYTKAREKWNPTLEELAAALKRRSAERKRRKAS